MPTLHGLLKGTDRELSGQATEALGLIGAGEAAPTLETYWVDACAARRHDAAAAAALALWRVSKSDKALAYLQERVREKSPDAAVLKAIAGVGAPAQNNVPDLIRVLNGDPDVTKRLLAADALGRIGLADHKAIPPLITALKHPDVELRIRAARALARFEDAADNAVSRLLDLIHDPVSPRLRYAAGEALRQIDPVAARDAGIP
ncbi:MAG: hypothetical protein AUI36_37310 [Cyanobacteria bacterium 13_1_40CM_2_61_4]|nr:MAG: hypothetical protein AUI36_37310 [Cyanobacteria bacterium 13_1_40CM_2_61_4]